IGVAADQDTGEAATANSVGNTVTVLNVATGGTNTISTGQRPIAVAFNYTTHQIAVAASGGNSVGIADAAGSTIGKPFGVGLPTSILYDPIPDPTTQLANNFLALSSTN